MSFLIRAAILAAAGAAGWALAKRKKAVQNEPEGGSRVVYLSDEDAVIDAVPQSVSAEVKSCFRRMDPLTLTAANEAVFHLEDGTEVRLNFVGDGGLHLLPGERGMLTWKGMRLIRFEKESGEVIGGVFYSPAEEELHA